MLRKPKDGLDMSAGSMIATEEKDEGKAKVTQKLDDFDVESVLSSIGEGRAQGAELGGGGVVLTDDAYDMGDQLQDSIDSGGVNLGDSTERIGHTLAFDIDDILNPEAEEESEFEFTAPQRTSREPLDRKRVPLDRKRVTGRQSVSSNEEVNTPNERGPPKRRAVRKAKKTGEDSTRKGPPSRKSPPKRKPDLDDSDDFSDFSF